MMKPKIGYVYCLWSFYFPWRYKVGYSASPDFRLADIQASMQAEYGRHVKVSSAIKMPMLWAYKFEQAIHNSAFWRPVAGMRGSGYTEWSTWLNIVSALIVGILAYSMDARCWHYVFALVLLIPFPLDYCLFILTFALFQYAIAAGSIFVLLKFFV